MKYFHIFLIVAAIAILFMTYKMDLQCRMQGGVYVKTLFGAECIKK